MLNELKRIKEKLNQLIEEVEILEKSLSNDELIVGRNDFKKIKHKSKINSYLHKFEYVNGIFFILPSSGSNNYEISVYNKLMTGELDRIILVKKKTPYEDKGDLINYELEEWHQTKLREIYRETID